MKKSKPKVWLARDTNKGYGGHYILAVGHKPFPIAKGVFIGVSFCAKDFEKSAPKSCHLPPGHKAIEITVDIKR